MTKRQALEQFRAEILPYVVDRYGPTDKPAQSEAWNDWTDSLCKNREITLHQYESWVNPY